MSDFKDLSPFFNTSKVQSSNVVMTVSNLFLRKPDTASIRAFPNQYDQHFQTVIARAKQIQSAEGTSTTKLEAILSMLLKYCVDAQHFISCMALGFIEKVTSFDKMTFEQLRLYLQSEVEESKDFITVEALEEMGEKKLKINEDKENARSRMQDLFANYLSLLSQQSVRWIMEKNQKRALHTFSLHSLLRFYLNNLCPTYHSLTNH